jgi:hypothetical protein
MATLHNGTNLITSKFKRQNDAATASVKALGGVIARLAHA